MSGGVRNKVATLFLTQRKKEANTLLHGRFARVKREFDEWVGWCVLLLLSPCLGHFRVVEAGEGGYRVNGSHSKARAVKGEVRRHKKKP